MENGSIGSQRNQKSCNSDNGQRLLIKIESVINCQWSDKTNSRDPDNFRYFDSFCSGAAGIKFNWQSKSARRV